MSHEHISRLGELFCGAGGLALGAKRAFAQSRASTYHIRHVWATDNDRDAIDTFVKNIANGERRSAVCADIRKLDLSRLRQLSEIDALAFGFPCNDFSIVGEQKGLEGSFGALYEYGVQALEIFRPTWFLAENVGGLRNSNDGSAFERILMRLCGAGYRVTAHLYKFEQYGVPQSRHRIILVGFRNDTSLFFRPPSPEPYANIDVSARTALEVPPIPQDARNHEKTRQSEDVVRRLGFILPGQNAFNADIPAELQLNVKGARISQIYRRLHPEQPAYTITGSGGGGTHVYHWKEDRALTNRERARLQTFPDDFVFEGSKESVRKQIGMAVPPRAAEVIFNAILSTIARVDYPSVEPNLGGSALRLFEKATSAYASAS